MKHLCVILILTSIVILSGCENKIEEPSSIPQIDKIPTETSTLNADWDRGKIIGEWPIENYAINALTGEEYPLQNLYGSGFKYGGVLIFREDGSFSKYIGVYAIEERNSIEGKFDVIDGVIRLEFEGGRIDEAVYIPETQKIEYHRSGDDYFPRIYEYYIRK